MERVEFDNTLKDFEMFFSDLSPWQRDEYYNALKKYPGHLFNRAYKRLRNTYKFRRTPLPGEIEATMRELLDEGTQSPTGIDTLEGCDRCGQVGVKIEDKGEKQNPTAIPCSCPKGERYKHFWGEHFKRRRA